MLCLGLTALQRRSLIRVFTGRQKRSKTCSGRTNLLFLPALEVEKCIVGIGVLFEYFVRSRERQYIFRDKCTSKTTSASWVNVLL